MNEGMGCLCVLCIIERVLCTVNNVNQESVDLTNRIENNQRKEEEKLMIDWNF